MGLGAELLVVSAVSEGLVGEAGTSDAVGAGVLVREGEGTVTVRDGVGMDSDREGSGRFAPPSQEARSMEIPATAITSARLAGTTRDRGTSRGTPTPFRRAAGRGPMLILSPSAMFREHTRSDASTPVG